MDKLKIISTSDLYSKEKKKGKQKILTTKDVPDVLPMQEAEQSALKTITTSDVKEKENEKE